MRTNLLLPLFNVGIKCNVVVVVVVVAAAAVVLLLLLLSLSSMHKSKEALMNCSEGYPLPSQNGKQERYDTNK